MDGLPANFVVESPVIGRGQSVLYAFAGVAYLLMSVLAICFLTPELTGANLQMMGYGVSYILGHVMIMMLLFTELTFSIRGKLTPKETGVIATAYFGTGLISNIFALIQAPGIYRRGDDYK